MRDNEIQFAAVREDPLLVIDVARRIGARRVLVIGSGGCTALSLQALAPEIRVCALDPNPAQLRLIERKIAALKSRDDGWRASFNIGDDSPTGLCQCGNFESLFRGLRGFVHEFIADPVEVEAWFQPGPARDALAERVFACPYWPVAFELFLHDALLNAMFGPDATQHATPGSYPGYLRRLFERGLTAPTAPDNYFLHHVFLGRYLDREESLPPYLAHPPRDLSVELRQGFLQDQTGLAAFDLVDLSNVMDWMDDASVEALVAALRAMTPGSTVLYRQLNNRADRESQMHGFEFDPAYGRELHRRERSLFYESLHVGVRSG